MMEATMEENDVLKRLLDWGDTRPSLRAMILTSTRAVPRAKLDPFSDYDVILAVTSIEPYYQDRGWLEDFGRVLVVYRDPLRLYYGLEKFAYITQYEDGLKIDFTIWPEEILRRAAADPRLPDELDAGYKVLLDKDGLADALQPPTYSAYIPSPPDEAEYLRLVEEFFHETTYVAKLLWRDELMPAKYSLDYVMKVVYLRPMLEWLVEIENDWNVKPGVLGKGLKRYLKPELWTMLESTYVGPGINENWKALFRSIELFRLTADLVAEKLGFIYPDELEQRVGAYLKKIRNSDDDFTRLDLE